ncbi:hypothetical protein C3K47_17185 [Solitalea longa]|uniref:Uncharacterized protein n=2 Tax=Solitalea longa TaxID=2079460 RepID=A0A2S4ZYI5_9SPHI|nr:hypothetical protein C3K47_17185 [Solitalea longa]
MNVLVLMNRFINFFELMCMPLHLVKRKHQPFVSGKKSKSGKFIAQTNLLKIFRLDDLDM